MKREKKRRRDKKEQGSSNITHCTSLFYDTKEDEEEEEEAEGKKRSLDFFFDKPQGDKMKRREKRHMPMKNAFLLVTIALFENVHSFCS